MKAALSVAVLFKHASRLLLARQRSGAWGVPERTLPPGTSPTTTAHLTLWDTPQRAMVGYRGLAEYVRPVPAVHRLRFFMSVNTFMSAIPDLTALTGAETCWVDRDGARELLGNRFKELPEPFPPDGRAQALLAFAATLPDSTVLDRAQYRTTRISARMAARDVAGRMLLVKSRSSDTWVLPGGHYEAGETVAQCAERETREEAGVETIAGPLYWLYEIHDTLRDALVLEFIFSGRVTGDHPAAFTAIDEDGSLRQVRLFSADELATLPKVYPSKVWRLPELSTAPVDAYRVTVEDAL